MRDFPGGPVAKTLAPLHRMEMREGWATLLKVTPLGNGMVIIQLQTWCSPYYTGAELVANKAGSPLSLWFWLV